MVNLLYMEFDAAGASKPWKRGDEEAGQRESSGAEYEWAGMDLPHCG